MEKPEAPPRFLRPPSYSKVRIADLVARLVQRGLPHVGKRADLIERLREDDCKKENERGHPKDGVSRPTDDSTRYHSVYYGPTQDSEGKFSHFVRAIDESHRRRGYWQFSSIEDELKAHARGFSSPEEVLLEQDRSQESYDSIILDWVPGTDDANKQEVLSGTPSVHLITMYELRVLLGQPLSLRGQAPVYPVGQDPRLKKYWKSRANLTPTNDFKSPSSIPFSTIPQQTAQSSEPQPHHQNIPPQQSIAACIQKQSELQDNYDICIHTNNFCLQQSPRLDASSLISPPGTTRPPAPINPADIYKPKPVDGQVDDQIREKSCVVYKGSKESQYPPMVFELEPIDDNAVSISRSAFSNTIYCKGLPDVQASPPSTCKLESSQNSTPGIWQHIRKPLPDHLRSPLPPSNPAQCALLSPQPPGQIFDSGTTQQIWFEQIENGLNVADSEYCLSSAHAVEMADPTAVVLSKLTSTMNSPKKTSGYAKETTDLAPVGSPIPPIFSNDTSATLGAVLGGDSHVISGALQATSSYDTLPDPPRRLPFAYLDLPCMDCGLEEVDGHKPDCHIGNISFSERLTVLDYRRLADAVEHFDPGPWVTHFNTFSPPPPEEPEAQIQNMAEIIRKEQSYKDDVELHGLPDAALVLLWAFKTSPGIQVITP